MPQRDVRAYLIDARAACEAVTAFLSGVEEQRYLQDLLLRSAVERQLLIVGESMNHIKRMDPLLAATLGDVWGIIAFRNLLVHGYFLIKSEIVWSIATRDVPRLQAAIDVALKDATDPPQPGLPPDPPGGAGESPG